MDNETYKVINPFGGSACILTDGFYLDYSVKGSIVKAPDRSLGIACFKEEIEAVRFQLVYGNGIIIRVEPIGEPVERMWCGSIIDIPKFYDYYLSGEEIPEELLAKVQKGTVWYPAVRVLDDYLVANLNLSEDRKKLIEQVKKERRKKLHYE